MVVIKGIVINGDYSYDETWLHKGYSHAQVLNMIRIENTRKKIEHDKSKTTKTYT